MKFRSVILRFWNHRGGVSNHYVTDSSTKEEVEIFRNMLKDIENNVDPCCKLESLQLNDNTNRTPITFKQAYKELDSYINKN